MSVQTFDANAALSVTDAAAEHFRKRLAGAGKTAVRISVKVRVLTWSGITIGDEYVESKNRTATRVQRTRHCRA